MKHFTFDGFGVRLESALCEYGDTHDADGNKVRMLRLKLSGTRYVNGKAEGPQEMPWLYLPANESTTRPAELYAALKFAFPHLAPALNQALWDAGLPGGQTTPEGG
jgi:hypothetical protein